MLLTIFCFTFASCEDNDYKMNLNEKYYRHDSALIESTDPEDVVCYLEFYDDGTGVYYIKYISEWFHYKVNFKYLAASDEKDMIFCKFTSVEYFDGNNSSVNDSWNISLGVSEEVLTKVTPSSTFYILESSLAKIN